MKHFGRQARRDEARGVESERDLLRISSPAIPTTGIQVHRWRGAEQRADFPGLGPRGPRKRQAYQQGCEMAGRRVLIAVIISPVLTQRPEGVGHAAKEWPDLQSKDSTLGHRLQMNNLGQREYATLIKTAGRAAHQFSRAAAHLCDVAAARAHAHPRCQRTPRQRHGGDDDGGLRPRSAGLGWRYYVGLTGRPRPGLQHHTTGNTALAHYRRSFSEARPVSDFA